MEQFEVGKAFPRNNSSGGSEKSFASLNEAFFDAVYYIVGADEYDVKVFCKSELRYGMYEEKSIPFLIFDFPKSNWNFDLTINILKAKEDKIDDWLNSDANLVTLFLVDARSNILLGMRTISVLPSFAERLRDVLELQTGTYEDKMDVEETIIEIATEKSTAHMMAKTQMLRLNG